MKTMAVPFYPWSSLLFLFVTLLSSPFARCEVVVDSAGAATRAIYDPDPNHLWNRLHGAFFIRVGNDGTEYGIDQLDPLLFYRSKHLLVGSSHTNALKVLDEFLASRGESLISDPLKRALLQRDLWAVFDWTAHPYGRFRVDETVARRSLRQRLAPLLQRLALTQQQIDGLPDNYAAAVSSHKFRETHDSSRPAASFLPPDLLSTNGSWVRIGINASSEEPLASVHTTRFGGRSVFLVFMRTAGGRQEAIEYLRRFREFPEPYIFKPSSEGGPVEASLNANLPALPAGTIFALVRQTILIGDTGELIPTHLTESVQLRCYNDVEVPRNSSVTTSPEGQSVFEFSLSRAELFREHAGGLQAASSDQKAFLQFMDKGFDPFEESERDHKPITPWLHRVLDCRECHSAPGLFSVLSLVRTFSGRQPLLLQVSDVEPKHEGAASRIWKAKQFNWGVLQGLWEKGLPAPLGNRESGKDL